MEFEFFDNLTPKEVNIKLGYFVKRKIEDHFWELQKLCLTINVHLSKKDRLTPQKMIEDSKTKKQVENLSPEDKADMMKSLVSNTGSTQDFLDKKKADVTIKELRRQGKLK